MLPQITSVMMKMKNTTHEPVSLHRTHLEHYKGTRSAWH